MKLKNLIPLIGLVILIAILFTLDLQKIAEIFTSINPLYSFLSFFTIVPLILIANVEWQLLLRRQKIHISFWYSIKNFFIGYFYGSITPGGFGAYTRALYLSDESKAPLPKCFSNIVIFNTIELFAMLLPGTIGALYLSSIYPYLFFIIIGVVVLIGSLFMFFFKKERSKILFTKIVQSRIFATLKDKLEGSIDSFYEDLPRFRDVLLPYSISLLGWILKYVMLFFIAKLFLINAPFVVFILIMAVADVIASIPISIYGIGTREVALITMFTMPTLVIQSITAEQIVSFSLFWYVIAWIVPSVIGAFVTIHETRKFYKFKLDEKTTKSFADYMKKYPELYENLAEVVRKNIPKRVKQPLIIDLGVGPGLLSKELNKKIPEAEIIGVDPSKEMLELAKDNAKLRTFVGSSEKIPLNDGEADALVTRYTLTYWDNPRDGFVEINRVLKSGGKIIIQALNRDFSRWKLFVVTTHMILNKSGMGVARYHVDAFKTAYSVDSVKKLLKDSGFEIIGVDSDKKDWKFTIVAEKV